MKKEILIKENELKEAITELNEKIKKLWEKTLSDADFINRARYVGSINIQGYYYRLHGCSELENQFKFWIEETPTSENGPCTYILSLEVKDGKAFLEKENTRDLKYLAKTSIVKYRVSKEIIKRVEEEYGQVMNTELKEITNLIEEIKNIDK